MRCGSTAVLVANNDEGQPDAVVSMSGQGDYVAPVPVVMISLVDGQRLRGLAGLGNASASFINMSE